MNPGTFVLELDTHPPVVSLGPIDHVPIGGTVIAPLILDEPGVNVIKIDGKPIIARPDMTTPQSIVIVPQSESTSVLIEVEDDVGNVDVHDLVLNIGVGHDPGRPMFAASRGRIGRMLLSGGEHGRVV